MQLLYICSIRLMPLLVCLAAVLSVCLFVCLLSVFTYAPCFVLNADARERLYWSVLSQHMPSTHKWFVVSLESLCQT